MREKLLFICSANLQRSPTAEALFRGSRHYDARSAGTSEWARVKVTEGHIGWADLIFAMEKRHRALLRQAFGRDVLGKPVVVLEVPDEYEFMEPALIDILLVRLAPHIEHLPTPKEGM